MDDYLISQFIDDEMDIDEKITFVDSVHDNQPFYRETRAMLDQEKRLRAPLVPLVSQDVVPLPVMCKRPLLQMLVQAWRPAVAGFAVAVLVAGLAALLLREPVTLITPVQEHRFVLYLPDARSAEIIGSFTDWQPVSLQRSGAAGYWTLTLSVPTGEHRYSFIVDAGARIADPTVIAREDDDFGGQNSVIMVGDA